MVYVVMCGVLLGIFILKLKEEFDERNHKTIKKQKSILADIYDDLIQMFYFQKPGKFIGPLEPLNNLNILNNLVMVEDNEFVHKGSK
jgi:hypothetical protein